MKTISTVTTLLLVLACMVSAVVVNNSGSTAEDSLTVPFYALDSTGNLISLGSGDSVFIRVWYPSGALAYEGAQAYNGSQISSQSQHGAVTYSWKEAVATIDGTPRAGVYSYQVLVHDLTSADLWTPHQGQFQLLPDYDYSVVVSRLLDSLQAVVDSLQSQDNWVAIENNAFDPSSDSVIVDGSALAATAGAVTATTLDGTAAAETADTISGRALDVNIAEISGDATAADNLESALDGTGGVTLSLSQLAIRATGNDTALIVIGSGTGQGGYFKGGATNGHGLLAAGRGSGYGLRAEGGATGVGLAGIGGGTSGYGFYIYAPGDVGMRVSSLSDTGIFVVGDIAADITGSIGSLSNPASVWNLPFTTSFSSGSMGDSLTNQSYVQGTAAGLDSADIARAVWNSPSANHVLTGSFGRYLDAQVSGLGSGSGAYSVHLVAFDSSISQTVENVMLAIRSIDQSNLIAVARTNSTGQATVNLDNDSYLSIATAPGYLFAPFDTLVVSGTGQDTVYGYQFNPGDPATPGLCRVFGFLYTLQGEPEQDAVVSAYLPKGVARTGMTIVAPNAVSALSDSTGYFYLDLIPSDSLIGSDSRYELTINRTDGTILRKRLKVPDESSWQLTW